MTPVLLITWNAFIDLPYFNRRDNWKIVVDELPQVAAGAQASALFLLRGYGITAGCHAVYNVIVVTLDALSD